MLNLGQGAASSNQNDDFNMQLHGEYKMGNYTVTLQQGAIVLMEWEFGDGDKDGKKMARELKKKFKIDLNKKTSEMTVDLSPQLLDLLKKTMEKATEITPTPIWRQVPDLVELSSHGFGQMQTLLSVLTESPIQGKALDKKISQKAPAHDVLLLNEFDVICETLQGLKNNEKFFNEQKHEAMTEAAQLLSEYISEHYLADYIKLYSAETRGAQVDTTHVDSSMASAIALLNHKYFQEVEISPVIYAYLSNLIRSPVANKDGSGVCTFIVNMLNEIADKHSSKKEDYVSTTKGSVQLESMSCEKGIKSRLALLHRNFCAIQESHQISTNPTLSPAQLMDAAKTFVAEKIRPSFVGTFGNIEGVDVFSTANGLMVLSCALNPILANEVGVPSHVFNANLSECVQGALTECQSHGLLGKRSIEDSELATNAMLVKFSNQLFLLVKELSSHKAKKQFLESARTSFKNTRAPHTNELDGYLEQATLEFLITQMPEMLRKLSLEMLRDQVERTEAPLEPADEPNEMLQNMFHQLYELKFQQDVDMTLAYMQGRMSFLKMTEAHATWFRLEMARQASIIRGKEKDDSSDCQSAQSDSDLCVSSYSSSSGKGKRKMRKSLSENPWIQEQSSLRSSGGAPAILSAYENNRNHQTPLRSSVEDLQADSDNAKELKRKSKKSYD